MWCNAAENCCMTQRHRRASGRTGASGKQARHILRMLAEWVWPLPEGMPWPPGVPPGGGSWTPPTRQMCLLPAASETPDVQVPAKCRSHDCELVTCLRASQLKQGVIAAGQCNQVVTTVGEATPAAVANQISTMCSDHGGSPVQMTEPGLAQQQRGDGACCAHQSGPPGHMQEPVALHRPPLSLKTSRLCSPAGSRMCSPAGNACRQTV